MLILYIYSNLILFVCCYIWHWFTY